MRAPGARRATGQRVGGYSRLVGLRSRKPAQSEENLASAQAYLRTRRRERSLAVPPKDGAMAVVVKGMVQVEGTTYRIARVSRGNYNVIRVLDDQIVGTFSAGKSFEMTPAGIEAELLREIARVAIQGAKTTWVGRIA
jgi:hypothetical protein